MIILSLFEYFQIYRNLPVNYSFTGKLLLLHCIAIASLSHFAGHVMCRVVHGNFSGSGKISEPLFHCVEKWNIIKAILDIFFKIFTFKMLTIFFKIFTIFFQFFRHFFQNV